ncbi:hypothetical protein ACFQZC_15515 [Streptacidiphilus monticola]
MSRPDRRPVVRAACAATLTVVLLLGITPLWRWAVAAVPVQLAPAEIGTPLLLPPLRLVPLGGTGWTMLACEDFAALVLVLVVGAVMGRHIRVWRRSSRRHRLAAGWGRWSSPGRWRGSSAGWWNPASPCRALSAGPATRSSAPWPARAGEQPSAGPLASRPPWPVRSTGSPTRTEGCPESRCPRRSGPAPGTARRAWSAPGRPTGRPSHMA